MSLLASIPGDDIKTFATILTTLGGIGDELHFEAHRGQLVLSMVNSSVTTLGKVYISYAFFEKYQVRREKDQPMDSVLVCQVAIKGFAALFKKQTKILNSIEIKLEGASSVSHSTDDEFRPCRISVKRNGPLGHSGFSRTKSMPFAQTHLPNIQYSKDTASRFVIKPGHLREYLNFFNSKVEEIVFVCSRFNMKLRNAGSSSITMDSSVDSRPFQIEVSLNMDQFDLYETTSDTMLTLSIKDFKTVVSYAEMLGEPVSAFFNDAGQPIVFSVQHTENTIFDMVLLTRPVPELNAYSSTQDDMSITRSSVNISHLSGRTNRSQRPAQPSPVAPPSIEQQEEPLFPSPSIQRGRNNSGHDLSMLPLQSGQSDSGHSRRSHGEQDLFAFGSPREEDGETIKRRKLAGRSNNRHMTSAGSGSDTDDGSGMAD
ncbi:Rad9-domain-containing protein [Umbelopsis sp. AD052]|nr:Rad9-domain-containing protein [Umbelopsis sp. AD052]